MEVEGDEGVVRNDALDLVTRNLERANRRDAEKERQAKLVEKIIAKLNESPESVVDKVGELLGAGFLKLHPFTAPGNFSICKSVSSPAIPAT
jgi:hypothetical protein